MYIVQRAYAKQVNHILTESVTQKITNRILGPKLIALKILLATFFLDTLYLFFNLFYFILASWAPTSVVYISGPVVTP